MKHFFSIVFILTIFVGFSQSLPINFENDLTTSDFVDFDGGTAMVTANPSVTGINTSATVAQIVRDGEAIFGGSKIVLTDNLDFSVLTKISMKVYTTAPIGTKVKFKLEDSSGPTAVDVDAFTTVSGAWETLEWVFVGTPNNFNQLVFMFDFGNIGDGSATSTFYFDDIEQVEGPTAPVPMSLPIGFEMGEVDTDFLNYSGAIASIIPNPHMDSSNMSNSVGQVVRSGGEYFAGSKIFLDNTIDLSTLWQMSMKIYTTAPVGTRIKLELENASGTTNLDYLTTVSGAWETATWNFHGNANYYDRIQFLFDFGNVGDGSATSTFLFDDVKQEVGPTIPDPIPTSMPIDFENNVVTTDFTDFFGAITTVIPNPQIDANNPSATVGQFVRSGGAGFMRSKLALTNFIPNMANLGRISMKVYTEAPIGTLLKFKLESNVAAFGKEQDVLTTVSGEWATYTWDLSNGDNPIYNVLTLMLGYNGPNDASTNATFLFDDIEQVETTLSIDDDLSFNIDKLSIYPNPAKDYVTISSKTKTIKTIKLFSILGNQVKEIHPIALEATINVTDLPRGIYISKISTLEGEEASGIKLIIE